MSGATLKNPVGPSARHASLPIPIAIVGAAVVSAPFWLAMAWTIAG